MRRSRLAPFAILAFGLALFAFFQMRAPRDQTMRVVLGDAAPRVTGVALRYRERERDQERGADEWSREATFSYLDGGAPRILSHEPRLANGEYVVEIDLRLGEKAATIERRVTFSGGTLSLDVSQAIAK